MSQRVIQGSVIDWDLPETQKPGQAWDLLNSGAVLSLIQFLLSIRPLAAERRDGFGHTSWECLPSSTFQANVINFMARTI